MKIVARCNVCGGLMLFAKDETCRRCLGILYVIYEILTGGNSKEAEETVSCPCGGDCADNMDCECGTNCECHQNGGCDHDVEDFFELEFEVDPDVTDDECDCEECDCNGDCDNECDCDCCKDDNKK